MLVETLEPPHLLGIMDRGSGKPLARTLNEEVMATSSNELFPSSPREIYEKAPLVQVVCQLRFPPILRIESQIPAEFQERIRTRFPLFERTTPALPSPLPIPAEITQILGPQVGLASYQFLTEDRSSTLGLSRESVSLTTNKYDRWEEFRDDFQEPLNALIELYRPSFFVRVGLRYVDAIDREALGLGKRRWSELLRPPLLGELGAPLFEEHLEAVDRVIRVRLPDASGSVQLRHGLATVRGEKKLDYIIDFDFFTTQRVEVGNAEPILTSFNRRAGNAFRWCITDILRAALRPITLGPATGSGDYT
jgi:uncharacterized protein (TIGR04255 family)